MRTYGIRRGKIYVTAFLTLFSFYFGLSHSVMVQAETLSAEENFPFTLNITKALPANLLKNPGFEALTPTGDATGTLSNFTALKAAGLVRGESESTSNWTFGNFAGSSEVQAGVTNSVHGGAAAVFVRSEGDWPGYWFQKITVQEGMRYYASVYLKPMMTDGTVGLRMHTKQYKDEGSWTTRNSHTTIQLYATCGQGVGLGDFIDPAYLWVVRRGAWNRYEFEFVVPKGKNVNTYDFWAGLYGVGTVYVDDAYLGPAVIELNGNLSGPALKRLRILDQDDAVYLDQPLNAGESEHAFKVVLESRLKRIEVTRYSIEVTDAQGVIWRKPL